MCASRTQTVAPVATPIDVAELKQHLRIDHTADDADLAKLIGYVTASVESFLGWQLCQATWRLDLDKFEPGQVLRPLPAPLIAVTSIAYFDTDNNPQTWDTANYEVDAAAMPARIRPVQGQTWPSTYDRFNAASVTFTAGFADVADVPGWAKMAIRLECASRYELRLNTQNWNTVYDLSGFFGGDARSLLGPHRLAWQFGGGLDVWEKA